MKGGEALLRSLVRGGVEVCFMNAGTSEMHVVAALDAVGGLRAVLGLFEGVVTGCADGYGRMAERPAATLLHLGPGLGNGIANLHNARRAHTPVLNLVGDHATYHRGLDAPLESDIESLARPVSGWYRSCARREELVGDVKEAIAAAIGPPGCVATLVVPADLTWLKATTAAPESAGEIAQATRGVSEDVLCEVQAALESKAPCGLLLGGSALRRRGLLAAGRIAARCGAKLLSEPFPARLEQGAGVVAIERLAYFAELASAQLAGLAHLVLVGGRRPVSPFAYPDLESDLVPQDCVLHVLSGPGEQAPAVLEELAEKIGAPKSPSGIARLGRDGLPSGELSAAAAAGVIGALLPEEAIVSDESITAGI
ncbi:MAG: acetolactate synthase large subunit, partial [Acidimicrobiales bacterium]